MGQAVSQPDVRTFRPRNPSAVRVGGLSPGGRGEGQRSPRADRQGAPVSRGQSKVVAIMSMSLDGYVADGNNGVAEVFEWYMSSGDVDFHTGGSDPMTF